MKIFKTLGLLLICWLSLLLTFSANAGNLSAGSYGYDANIPLIPICGGEGQDDCIGTSATFEGSATGVCPEGSTFNLFSWGCHTCPEGYTLSMKGGFDPDSDRACQKPKLKGDILVYTDIIRANETNTAPAEIKGTVCPAGSFFDPIRDGECWTCPKGYDRAQFPNVTHIDSSAACLKVTEQKRALSHAYGKGVFATDCPTGQFWDGWDGRCHSCPSGFKRSTSHINSSKACSKLTSVIDSNYFRSARLVKEDAFCEDGEDVDPFLEAKRGGTCFSCPPTYDRTGAPVTDNNACATPKNIDFTYATRVTDLTCPVGQEFDFINWQHRRVVSRARGFKLDKNNKAGGTCWSCPDMSAGRSAAAVFEPDACVAPDIRWEMPDWTSPGVYGRYDDYAAEDLVSELITNRTFINSIVEQLWNADQKKSKRKKLFKGLSFKEMKAEVWAEIITRPETSGVLRLALKSILVRQALGKKGLPLNSHKFLVAFEDAVTKYRTFLVEQSKQAFEIWDKRAVERDVYKSNQSAGEVAKKALFAIAMLPWPPQSVPDYRSEAEQLTLDLQTTEAALKMAAINESLPRAFRNKILPVSYVKPREKKDKQLTQVAAEESKDYLYDETQDAVELSVKNALRRISLGPDASTPIEILEYLEEPFEDAATRARSGAVSHSSETTRARSNTVVGETRARSNAVSHSSLRDSIAPPDTRTRSNAMSRSAASPNTRARSNAISIAVDPSINQNPAAVVEELTRKRSGAVSWSSPSTRARSGAISQPLTRGRVASLVTPNPGSVVIKGSRSGAQKMASAVLKFAKFAEGPLLAVDVILTIQDVYGEVIVDRLTMGKQYDNALEMMSQPYSLKTALASNASTGEFDLYVNVIMHNATNDTILKITPPSSWAADLCSEGNLIIGNGVAVCNLGCAAEGAEKIVNRHGQCELGKAPKYVDSIFVSKSNGRHSCPTDSYYMQDDVKHIKSCMTCPSGYMKYGNWDMSKNKKTSIRSKYGGECVFNQQQSTVAPLF